MTPHQATNKPSIINISLVNRVLLAVSWEWESPGLRVALMCGMSCINLTCVWLRKWDDPAQRLSANYSAISEDQERGKHYLCHLSSLIPHIAPFSHTPVCERRGIWPGKSINFQKVSTWSNICIYESLKQVCIHHKLDSQISQYLQSILIFCGFLSFCYHFDIISVLEYDSYL